jgi:transcriptional regulator with XRE-family HTH domain
VAQRSGTKPAKKAEKLSPAHVALGLAVQDLRTARGWSQEELADRAETHRTYLGGIERGERNPSFSKLLAIAGALDTSVVDLVAASVRYS